MECGEWLPCADLPFQTGLVAIERLTRPQKRPGLLRAFLDQFLSAVALGFLGLGRALGLAGRGGTAISSSLASWPSPTTATVTVPPLTDRKSTRLNSSHVRISYAVFCLKKKIESSV